MFDGFADAERAEEEYYKSLSPEQRLDLLLEIIAPDRKILTVEDPVEYQLEGINQIQVKPQNSISAALLEGVKPKGFPTETTPPRTGAD